MKVRLTSNSYLIYFFYVDAQFNHNYDKNNAVELNLDAISVTNPSEANDPPDPEDLKAIDILEKAIHEEINFRQLLESELTVLRSTISRIKMRKLSSL